jgi:hypothetical protein
MESCTKCGAPVSLNQRACSVCHTDAGFPNVRQARSAREREVLNARYETAKEGARASGVQDEFERFEAAVRAAKVVMNRSFGALHSWVNGQDPLFHSFHFQVEYLGRKPDETDWDQQRESAESAINPFCYRDLSYAALSLDHLGMTYYGQYSITLRTVTIEDRTSVFDQNPFVFNRVHHVISGRSPPLGYRAAWDERSILAVAKLEPKITSGIGQSDFPTLLLEPRRDESDCDFVEAHIFGPVNREGIECIIGPRPHNRTDQILWKQAVRKAKTMEVVVEETA